MRKVEWFWCIIALLVAAFIALLPSLSYSFNPAYKLYVYNKDGTNYYNVRVTNDDTRWRDTVTVEADSCVVVYRMEPGEYSIRTYKNGGSIGDHAGFEIDDHDLCIEITSATGRMRLCNKTYCD